MKIENIDVKNIELSLEDDYILEASYSDESEIYPIVNIKVEKGFYTVFELKRKYDSTPRRIILDSSFQREVVWSPKQKSELIESILMGLPLPIFYFNEDKKGRLIVVDGRQRLTALFEFMDNRLILSKNLKVLQSISGKKFTDLEALMQSKIEDYQIHAHVIQPPTPDRLKFDIFDRVNRAGTQLNKQEIRNALYQGEATKLLDKLSNSEEFNLVTSNSFKNNSRMKDKYIILRFLALYLYFDDAIIDDSGKVYVYKNDMDELLGRAMDTINTYNEIKINILYEIVIDTCKKVYFYVGDDAFRLKLGRNRSPINMNLFECIMYFFMHLDADYSHKPKYIKEKINWLKNDSDFLDSIGNHRDSVLKIKKRFDIIKKLLEELDDK